MNDQARRIIEKHSQLMGSQNGLEIKFFLKNSNPNSVDHWKSRIHFCPQYPQWAKSFENSSLDGLFMDLEVYLDEQILFQASNPSKSQILSNLYGHFDFKQLMQPS